MTLSTTLPFTIGSIIYHTQNGVGTIKSVQEEVIAGETCTMCGIKLHRKNSLIRVIANPKTLKDIADFAGANALATTVTILGGKGAPKNRAPGKWFPKFTELEKQILTTETLAGVAEAVRDLSRPQDAEIPPSERPLLINTKWRLVDTLVAVTGFTETDVLRLINQALIDSGKNALPE